MTPTSFNRLVNVGSPPFRRSPAKPIGHHASPPRIRRFDLSTQQSLRLAVPLLWIGMAGLTIWSVALSYRLSVDHDFYLRRRKAIEILPDRPRIAFLQGDWEEPTISQRPMKRMIDSPKRGQERDPTRLYSQLDSSRDFPEMERRVWPHHELDAKCEPMHSWQSHFDPVCNVFHEMSWQDEFIENNLDLISSKGFWRDAWKHQRTNDSLTATVWRTFKLEHPMEEAFFENARVDAVVMERLSSSPYIMNMYGFCGMSVVTEFAGKELSDVAAKLNSTERLKLAIKVAHGVSDMHSIQVAYNDLNLANLRMTEDGRPVLNDFNIAVLLMKHRSTGQTCPFVSRFPNPQWRAPEEQVYSQEETDSNPPVVNEKIDIYAMGNVLYRLAVGASPWKAAGAVKLSVEEKFAVAQLKRANGTEPSIPDHIDVDDPPTRVMLQAMKQAYSFDPKARPTAGELLMHLQEGLQRTLTA